LTSQITDLRATIARIERSCPKAGHGALLRFGIAAIDRHLPLGGLGAGLHEMAGVLADREHATAPTLLAASLLAGVPGPVIWAVERGDLFAPGLLAAGLALERLIVVEAAGQMFATLEEAARVPGLAGVVGEFAGELGSKASRRLQLAAEAAGVAVLAVRRPRHAGMSIEAPNAAATRWRVGVAPSEPADAIGAGPFSLTVGRARWRLDLIRARGAAPGSWLVEAFDETGRLAVPAVSADRSAVPPRRAAGGAAGDVAA
jgi:protein ImuA